MDVSIIFFEQWKDSRPIGAGPIEWKTYKSEFKYRIFPREWRKAKLGEFIYLKQDSMSVKE